MLEDGSKAENPFSFGMEDPEFRDVFNDVLKDD